MNNLVLQNGIIPSVNFHLWEPCNFRCKFCFATFQDVKSTILPKGHLTREETIAVTCELARFGFKKITFVGGEPTLCPWLPELIATAKANGLTTMIVTNGSRISLDYLKPLIGILDWVTLSIDSLNPEANQMSGRGRTGTFFSRQEYIEKCRTVIECQIRLKVNTVVHRLNVQENLSSFIEEVKPERWKIFKVLPVVGQNSGRVSVLLVTEEEYRQFLERNKLDSPGIEIIPENNDAMTGSYLMIDPAGRFFDNTAGKHTYSRPILTKGIEGALQGISYDLSKFLDRKGLYE